MTQYISRTSVQAAKRARASRVAGFLPSVYAVVYCMLRDLRSSKGALLDPDESVTRPRPATASANRARRARERIT